MMAIELRDYCATNDRSELTNDKVLSLCRENGIPPDAKELNDVFKMFLPPPEPENTE
ncbi:hypothetical protein [Treponema endosymbiont of Eucomonympha sp.]|uniref:hypothetical protein n=1 Tax=Treponema endosymbiont of Eucomonympha sp. TaxID=1580831 RepID=UPI000A63B7C3|nr:hypothetical protein [Treponema endosymbiont of Eucomonympha sp.]